jgi:predicted dehydrogenase
LEANKRPLRLGVVGASFISQQCHLPSFASLPECELVAMADMREDLLEAVANRYAIPHRYTSHLDMIRECDLDGVIIVVARPHTAEITRDCLSAKLHVLTEKPMALGLEQANHLAEIAKKHDLVYSVGYMKRFDVGVLEARKIIEERVQRGEQPITVAAHCYAGNSYCNPFGDLQSEQQRRMGASGWEPTFEGLKPELQEGYLAYLNTFSHTVNLLRFLFGASGTVQHVALDQEGQGVVTLELNGICIALSTAYTQLHGWNESVDVVYPDARVTLTLPPPLLKNTAAEVRYEQGGDQPHQITQPLPNWSWAFIEQARGFVDAVVNREQPVNSGADSSTDVEMIEEIWKRI